MNTAGKRWASTTMAKMQLAHACTTMTCIHLVTTPSALLAGADLVESGVEVGRAIDSTGTLGNVKNIL